MLSAYRFRLCPDEGWENRLNHQLDVCTEPYNEALSERTFTCLAYEYIAPRDKSGVMILQRALAEAGLEGGLSSQPVTVLPKLAMPEFTPVEIGPSLQEMNPVNEVGNKLPVLAQMIPKRTN